MVFKDIVIENLEIIKWPHSYIAAEIISLSCTFWHGQHDIYGLQNDDGKSNVHFLFIINFRKNRNRTIVGSIMKNLDSNISILTSLHPQPNMV